MGKPGTASPQQRGALSLAVHFFQPHQPVVEQSITTLVPAPTIAIRPGPPARYPWRHPPRLAPSRL